MSTSEKIKKIRTEKGLTQRELGELCGMADSAIRRYESGRANPKLGTIAKIAAALEVNIFELIDKEDFISQKNKLKEFLTPERKKESEEIEEWIELYEQQQKEEAAKNAPKFTAYDEKGNEIKAEKAPKFTTASRSHAQTEAYDLFHSLLSEEWLMTQEQEVIAVQLRNILSTYNELNNTGRKMAVKCIEELRYSDVMTDSQQDDIYFDRIKKKIKNGEKLAPDEIEWWHNYLDTSVKTVGAIFESLFSLLNKEGRRKAHTQINRAIEQIELLTKIPEYKKNPPEPPQE